MSEEKITVVMTKDELDAFELFQNRKQRKIYLTEIKAKLPNTLGTGVKNHIEKWLNDSLTTETLKLVSEQYNPIPVAPPPGRNQFAPGAINFALPQDADFDD